MDIEFDIIDFHTHCFADNLADRAMAYLCSQTDEVSPALDGKLSSLLVSMKSAGICKSVVCPIATKPAQYEGILQWCKEIRSDMIVPFPSIHPDDPDKISRLQEIHSSGFYGIKIHPYYQNFFLNDAKMVDVYQEAQKLGLIVVCHTGFDIAFEHIRRGDPEKIADIKQDFPDLKFVATHLGGWEDWDEVDKYIIGKNIYMELSFSLDYLSVERAKRMICSHPCDYILFGTDSPWKDQQQSIELVRKLNLPKDLERKIFYENSKQLLGL